MDSAKKQSKNLDGLAKSKRQVVDLRSHKAEVQAESAGVKSGPVLIPPVMEGNTATRTDHKFQTSSYSDKPRWRPRDLGLFFTSNIFSVVRKHPVWSSAYLFLGAALAVTLFIIFQPAQALGPEKEIPESYTEPIVVSLGQDTLSVRPLSGNQVRVKRNNNQYIYEEAYKNTDVVQTDSAYKIKEELVFRKPGHPLEFRYQLGNLGNFIVEQDEEGNIIFHNKEQYLANGGPSPLSRVFTIPTPFVEDKQEYRSFKAVTTKFDAQQGLLVIEVDQDWLAQAQYPVILDPTIEINVLNVHSHPQQGDNWVVEFTTVGQEDLYIIPADQATMEDDVFVSLKCGNQVRQPQILSQDVIYFPDWSCNDVGQVVHFTAKAGKHTLRFKFGEQIAYAYNDPSDPWWDGGWFYRKEIIIDPAFVEYDGLFPVLVTTTDANLVYGGAGHMGNPDGSDIAFADAAANPLDYDLEYYDNATGQLVAWVETDISSSVNTSIYIYYGNPGAASQEDEAGTWDSNFKGVWHLAETSGQHQDSTGVNDSTAVSVTTQGAAAGQIGGADDFDGINDYVSILDSASLDLANAGTVEAWLKTDDVSRSETNFTSWSAWATAPAGAGTDDYSNVDSVIVGETIHYAGLMCSDAVEDFGFATESLSGVARSSWDMTTFTSVPNGCGGSEGGSLALDSDGDFLYYGAIGQNGTTQTFSIATSTTSYSARSAWTAWTAAPNSPAGGGANEGGGMDMVIVGNNIYYTALMLNAGTEIFSTSTGILGSVNAVNWDATGADPNGGATNENCSVAVDSDGLKLYYTALCNDGANPEENYFSASSTIGGPLSAWVGEVDPVGAAVGEMGYIDSAFVGGTLYHGASLHADAAATTLGTGASTEAYQTASSSAALGGALSWFNRIDGSSNPNGAGGDESVDISVESDGKNLYYSAFVNDTGVEAFFTASSSLPAHPFISKLNAYELIQVGTGFAFDWAGRPLSFATSTQAGSFYHVAVTHDGSVVKYYVNGNLLRTQNVTADFETNTSNLFLGSGSRSDGTPIYFDGIIDEVRVSDTARSAGWILTGVNNQTDATDSFYTFGNEEQGGGMPVGSGAKLRSGTIELHSGTWKINLEDVHLLFFGLLMPFGFGLKRKRNKKF